MVGEAKLNDKGINVKNLLHLIQSFAPSTNPKALVGQSEDLESLPVPSILLIDNHCVVYDGFDRDTGKVRIFEPVTRKVALEPAKQVHRFWGGEVICFADPQMLPRAYVAAIAFVAILVASPGVCLILLQSRYQLETDPDKK
jgi:hypothetical protein